MTYFAFTVDLGPRTFAEHVDRISDTPEAQELLEGARERVNPALEDAKQRVLGEHVEAPTAIGSDESVPASAEPEVAAPARARAKTSNRKALAPRASDAGNTRLPGRD